MTYAELLAAEASQPVLYAMAFILGALWGSFANVCIYRWPPTDEFPDGRSVVRPPSHCFVCKHRVTWYDNLPLVSYLWLRGRCRHCKTGFSGRYLIVEALTGALFAVAWWAAMVAGPWGEAPTLGLLRFAIYAAFCFVMVIVIFIDLDHQLILNKLTYPSIPLAYGASLLLPERTWQDGLIGAALGIGLVVTVDGLYRLLRGRTGMGMGDAKLLAIVGALLGWQGVMASLFGGALLGTVIAIPALLIARARKAPGLDGGPDDGDLRYAVLPFGPFLAMAAMGYLFVAPYLTIYWRLG